MSLQCSIAQAVMPMEIISIIQICTIADRVHSGEFFVAIADKVELIIVVTQINSSRTSTAHAVARSAGARTAVVGAVLVLFATPQVAPEGVKSVNYARIRTASTTARAISANKFIAI